MEYGSDPAIFAGSAGGAVSYFGNEETASLDLTIRHYIPQPQIVQVEDPDWKLNGDYIELRNNPDIAYCNSVRRVTNAWGGYHREWFVRQWVNIRAHANTGIIEFQRISYENPQLEPTGDASYFPDPIIPEVRTCVGISNPSTQQCVTILGTGTGDDNLAPDFIPDSEVRALFHP